MKKYLAQFLVGAFLVFCLVAAASAAAPGTLNWSYVTGGKVASSPAIASDGTVYVGSADGKLYAVKADGTLKWSYTTGGAISNSPAVASDGTVYATSADRNLYAINPDGTLKWSYAGVTVNASPAIGADGTIYAGADYKLLAISGAGRLRWTVRIPTDMLAVNYYFSSPAVASDGTVYTVSNNGKLYAINSRGGVRWARYVDRSTYSSPAIGSDGTIYVGARKALYAVSPKGRVNWSYVTTGAGNFDTSSPAVATDGTIYLVSSDRVLYALNASGALKWSHAIGGGIGFVVSTPAIGSDGLIYVGGEDHNLYAINPDSTLNWSYATGDAVNSSPAIASDGTVYVGSDDFRLYAFSSSSSGLADSAWPMFRRNLRRTGQMPLPVLTVAKSGTGTGTVTSAPSGIDCGTACSASYLKDVKVSLAADPGVNAVFSGWSGPCSGKGACKVTLDGDKSVGAAFDTATCTYRVSPTRKTFSYRGGTVTVAVSARGADTCSDPVIAVSDSWITTAPVSLTHNRGSARVTVSANTGTGARTGTVTIGGVSLVITQRGAP